MADKQIITAWFREYSKDILNYLIYFTGRVDVEDIVQEVFIRALRRMDTFNQESSPKTWLLSIARNIAIDEMRKQQKEKDKQHKLLHSREPLQNPTPEDIYWLNYDFRQIYQSIQALKRNYRDVLILRGIKELSVGETAQILQWSENKVKVTYNRAIKALDNKLEGLSNES